MSVATCERVQAEWFRARARHAGGRVWSDAGLDWVYGPDGANLMFPRSIDRAALAGGVAAISSRPVGAWLSLDVDARPLAEFGFERGWAPWWMSAQLDDVRAATAARGPADAVIELTRELSGAAFCAVARDATGAGIGQAWSFVSGDVAGVFDMGVLPAAQRRGIGSALLGAVCAAATSAGARDAVLNATPEGFELYSRRGFRRVGEGITWWLHGS